jgi:hypothetical protein
VSEETRDQDAMTDEELEAAHAERLPPREQMSLVQPGPHPIPPIPVEADPGDGPITQPVPPGEM